MGMRLTIGFTTAVTAVLVMASSALAQDVPAGVYGGIAGDVQDQLTGSVGLDTLPFTGLDLVLLVGGGLTLLIVGVLARRASRTGS